MKKEDKSAVEEKILIMICFSVAKTILASSQSEVRRMVVESIG